MRTTKRHNHPDAMLDNPPKDEECNWEGYGHINYRNNNIPGPGSMTEYGWWEEEIEKEITKAMIKHELNRLDAIVHVFNAR